MSRIEVKGKDENGIIKADVIETPILVEELICSYEKMCSYEIYKALCEIRESSERDMRIRRIYSDNLRKLHEGGAE